MSGIPIGEAAQRIGLSVDTLRYLADVAPGRQPHRGIEQGKVRKTGRGERRQTTLRHLTVPANLPLEVEVSGTERWLTRSTA